jgi:predicted CoA-binding protein
MAQGANMSQPTIAILGASADRAKFGNKAVRAYLVEGYDVYPINPKGGQIEGLPVYRRLADLPVRHLNRISIYLPPDTLLDVLPEIADIGCDELWLNPGSESDAVVARAHELGLAPILACSIAALGVAPDRFA